MLYGRRDGEGKGDCMCKCNCVSKVIGYGSIKLYPSERRLLGGAMSRERRNDTPSAGGNR